jgi:translation elongation factor EF-1beta
MTRTLVYLKVELEHGEDEKTQRLAEEICRRIQKIYGVRSAEVSNMVSRSEE